jgi:hypothetical protein
MRVGHNAGQYVLNSSKTTRHGNLAQSAAYRSSSWLLLLPLTDVRMGYEKQKRRVAFGFPQSRNRQG